MYLKNTSFKHEEENLHEAFNISQDVYIRCRERVFFATLMGHMLCSELYENREDAPRELRTVTGDLQRVLDLITDPVEYEITLLHFLQLNRIAVGAYVHYTKMREEDENSETSIENELARVIKKLVAKKMEQKIQEIVKESDDPNQVSLEDLLKRIEIVKQSNRSFNKYMRLLGYPGYDHTDVDEMLRKSLES